MFTKFCLKKKKVCTNGQKGGQFCEVLQSNNVSDFFFLAIKILPLHRRSRKVVAAASLVF